eukprot:3620541-Amphidinium_carterae.2
MGYSQRISGAITRRTVQTPILASHHEWKRIILVLDRPVTDRWKERCMEARLTVCMHPNTCLMSNGRKLEAQLQEAAVEGTVVVRVFPVWLYNAYRLSEQASRIVRELNTLPAVKMPGDSPIRDSAMWAELLRRNPPDGPDQTLVLMGEGQSFRPSPVPQKGRSVEEYMRCKRSLCEATTSVRFYEVLGYGTPEADSAWGEGVTTMVSGELLRANCCRHMTGRVTEDRPDCHKCCAAQALADARA